MDESESPDPSGSPTASPTSEPSSTPTASTSTESSGPTSAPTETVTATATATVTAPAEPSCGTSARPCRVEPVWPESWSVPLAETAALVLLLLAALLFAQLRRP